MLSIARTLQLKLQAACSCSSDDTYAGDIKLLIDHVNQSEVEMNELSQLLFHIWSNEPAVQELDVSPSDAIKIALKIPQISHTSAITCIHMILLGKIYDRHAVYCLSEIQSHLYRTLHSVDDMSKLNDFEDELCEIASAVMACVRPADCNSLMKMLDSSGNALGLEEQGTMSASTLDLLPTVVEVLYLISQYRRKKQGTSEASSIRVRGGNSRIRRDIDVVDNFLSSPWPVDRLLSYSIVACDMWSHLLARHKDNLREKIIDAIPELSGNTAATGPSDDLPGVIRVCARLIDISGDVNWLHTLRLLYSSIPHQSSPGTHSSSSTSSHSLLTAEALLEQTFSQLPMNITLSIVECMENVALNLLHMVFSGSYSERCDMDTHIEYDGVPNLAVSDLNLILLLTRSGARNATSGETLQTNPDESLEVLTFGRAFLVLLICHGCIDFFVDYEDSGNDAKEKSLSLYCDPMREAVLRRCRVAVADCLGRQFATAGSSWITSVRAASIISFTQWVTLHHPSIALPLINMVEDLISSPTTTLAENTSLEGKGRNDTLQTILSACLEVPFEIIQDSRSSILNSLMKNIVSYAPKYSVSSPEARDGSKRKIASNKGHIRDAVYAFHASVGYLERLCSLYLSEVSALSSVLQTYIPTLTLLPVSEMEKVFKAMIIVCSRCTLFMGAMLSLCRKSLLHNDSDRKLFAVRTLMSMWPVVSELAQIEVVRSLQHAMNFPLGLRRTLYSSVINLVVGQNFGVVNDKMLYSKALLLMLETFVQKMDSFFVSFTLQEHTKQKRRQTPALNICSSVFIPDKCIDVVSSSSGSVATLNEEIEMLLAAIACIEICVCASRCECKDNTMYLECVHHTSSDVIFQYITQWINEPRDNRNAMLRDTLDSSFEYTKKFCGGILTAAGDGFLVSSIEVDDTSVPSTPNDQLSYLAGHMNAFRSAVTGVFDVLLIFDALREENNHGAQLEGMRHAVFEQCSCNSYLDHKYAFIAVMSALDAANEMFSHCCGNSKTIEGCFRSSDNSLKKPCSLLQFKKLEDILQHALKFISRVENDYSDERTIPFSSAAGLVSLCCSYISDLTDNLHMDVEVSQRSIQSLFTVYDKLCRVDYEDTLLKSVVNGLMEFATSHDIVRLGGSRRTAGEESGTRKRGKVSVYTEFSDQSDFSDSDDSDKPLSNDTENMLNEIPPLCVSNKGSGAKDVDVKESDFQEPYQYRFIRDIYGNLPVKYCQKLSGYDIQLLSGVFPSHAITERQLRVAAYDWLRPMLFRLRGDILQAMSLLIRRLGVLQLDTAEESGDSVILKRGNSSQDEELLWYLSRELKNAVEEGLTVRNFRSLIDVITALSMSKLHVIPPLSIRRTTAIPVAGQLTTGDEASDSIVKAILGLGQSTPPNLVRSAVALYLHLKTINEIGCFTIYYALATYFYTCGGSAETQDTLARTLRSDDSIAPFVDFFTTNAKLVEPVMMETINFIQKLISARVYISRRELSSLQLSLDEKSVFDKGTASSMSAAAGLSELVFFFLREIESLDFCPGIGKSSTTNLHEEVRNTSTKTAVVRGSVKHKNISGRTLNARFLLFKLPEKLQRRVLSVLTGYFRQACEECACIHRSVKSLYAMWNRRRDTVQRNKLRQQWEDGPWSSEDESESGEPSDEEYSGVDMESAEIDEAVMSNTSDGFTFLKLSLSASSASRNIILCVARNRKEIGNVASAGVLLLSRTDELIMRVVGLVRYFRSFEESFLRHMTSKFGAKFIADIKLITSDGDKIADELVSSFGDVSITEKEAKRVDTEFDEDEKFFAKKSRRKKLRLRSRNSVIDEWLEHEDGTDTYADLEDFVVF